MDTELHSSTLKNTFAYDHYTADAVRGNNAGPDTTSHSLSNVDVEYNLVKNLLEAKRMMTPEEDNPMNVIDHFLNEMGIRDLTNIE